MFKTAPPTRSLSTPADPARLAALYRAFGPLIYSRCQRALREDAAAAAATQEVFLRVLDSLQLTAKHSVATPADWKSGEDVIIVPSVSDEDAHKRFPGFVAKKPYLRVTPQPK